MAVYRYTIGGTLSYPNQTVTVNPGDDLTPIVGADPINPLLATLDDSSNLHIIAVSPNDLRITFAETLSIAEGVTGATITVDTGNQPVRLVRNLVFQTSSYTGLITSEHFDQPKFQAAVAAAVQPFVDQQKVLLSLPDKFDLDYATGRQLDAVGERVGRSRYVTLPLTNIYFSWATLGVGWGQGAWKGPLDPSEGLTVLPDDIYRLLLRAVIVANNWDGTVVGANNALSTLFNGSITPGTVLFVQDNFDMTMTIGLSGQLPPATFVGLLNNGEIPLRPVGVGVRYQVTSVTTTPIFGWGVNNQNIGGWGIGSWAAPQISVH